MCLLALTLAVGACGSPGPRLDSASAHERERAVGRADVADAARLARTDPSPGVRRAAVARLSEPALLWEIVRTDKDREVRATALRRIGDREALARFALQTDDAELARVASTRAGDLQRRAVEERLSLLRVYTPGMLVSVARSDPLPEARIAAIARLEDAAALSEIAASDAPAAVRTAAVNRQAALAKQLLEARVRALGEIQDQGELQRVATTSPEPELRRGATLRLAERDALRRILAEDAAETVRIAAIERLEALAPMAQQAPQATQPPPASPPARRRITDAQDLAAITRAALEDRSPLVRSAAVARVDDPAVLERVQREEKDSSVQSAARSALQRLREQQLREEREAVARSTDQAELARVAREHARDDVRLIAVRRVQDPQVLAAVARQDVAQAVRAAAASRVTDVAVLAELARSELSRPGGYLPNVTAIVRRIDDTATLLQLALDAGPGVAPAATERLQDPALLRRVFDAGQNGPARVAAMKRLADASLNEPAALDPRHADVRLAGANALTDVPAIERVVLASNDSVVRTRLVPKVRDPQVLATLARRENDVNVQRELADALKDSTVLGELALRTVDEGAACRAIAKTSDEEALRRLADPRVQRTGAYLHALAALKLLLLHPRVADRVSRPTLECKTTLTSEFYTRVGGGGGGISVHGDVVTLRLFGGGAELKKYEWRASFPHSLGGPPPRPLAANVDLLPLVGAAIVAAQLTEKEVVDLVLPSIAPLVRRAGIAQVGDAAVLRRVAGSDTDAGVRSAAGERLKAIGAAP